MTAIRALTIRQPWAAAIAYADKRVENRTWPTRYRGPVLIHTSKSVDRSALRHEPMAAVVRGLQLTAGAVIAVARVTGCHGDDGECTPWSATGHFHWTLAAEVAPLTEPVAWSGHLGLWTPTTSLLARVRAQLDPEAADSLLSEEAP